MLAARCRTRSSSDRPEPRRGPSGRTGGGPRSRRGLARVLTRTLARAGVVLAATAGALVTTAPPASAHGSGPGPTDYRSTVVAIQPAVPGLAVRLEEAGNLVVLTNRTGHDVVIHGYEDEPYLRVGPGGVFENRDSPTRYLNASTDEVPPASARRDAPVEWVRRSTGLTARWHDHRTHGGAGIGGAVSTAPWSLHLTVADREVVVVGERTLIAGPPAWPGVAAAVALAAAVVAIGRRRARGWARCLAVGLAAALALDIVRAAGGFAARVGETLPNRVFGELFFPALGWVAAVLALARLLRRPVSLPLIALFAAIPLFVFGGLSDLAVLWRSQLVFAYPGWLARAAAASALGIGGGLILLSVVELARPDEPARPPAVTATP